MQPSYLTLTVGNWYGWQMLPGYCGDYWPYFSPIFITEVKPLKSGKNILKLGFLNAHYAQGVADFDLKLKILKKSTTYFAAELLYNSTIKDRTAIISIISEDWLAQFTPSVIKNYGDRTSCSPKENIQRFLDECYLPRAMWR